MTAGLCVYKDTNNKLQISTITTAITAQVIGLYGNTAGAADQPSVVWGEDTIVTAFPTLVAGTVYFLGATGTIIPYGDLTTGQYMTIVGYAYTTTSFKIHIVQTGLTKA